MMSETKINEWQRKINNGKRKQAEKIQREKDKVWDRLKDTSPPLPKFHWDDDLVSMHSLDLEKEMQDALAKEIVTEEFRAWEEKIKQDMMDFLSIEYKRYDK